MGTGCSWRRLTCPGTTSTSAPAPSETSSPATYVARRWRRRASLGPLRSRVTHVLPLAVLARPRAGITPDITAPTRVGMPAQAVGAPPQPPRYTMMDAKTLSGANESPTSCTTRDRTRGSGRRRRAPVAERAWRANGEYIAKARTLDHEHSRQADGTRYPGVREQVQGHLVGPVLAAAAGLRPGARPCGGLVSGLQRGAARPRAGGGGGEGDGDVAADGGACGACMRRWGSTRTTCTAAGVAVFWRSWAPSSAAACPSLGSRTPTTRYGHRPLASRGGRHSKDVDKPRRGLTPLALSSPL